MAEPFDMESVEKLKKSKHYSNATRNASWAAGVDGYNQPMLDMWAKLTNDHPLSNASLFDRTKIEGKERRGSPRAIGCYLKRWHLQRNLGNRQAELRPGEYCTYFLFEDDASCIPDSREQTLNSVRQLPEDWAMFYTSVESPLCAFPVM